MNQVNVEWLKRKYKCLCWYKLSMTTKSLNDSGYYKLINECSYSSIDHMHIQVQYILQMFDLFTIEWGEKKT